MTVGIDFDQNSAAQPNPPFFPFATNDTLASIWNGEIVVDAAHAGTYTFRSASDDGSVVHIDGNYVLNNNFYQGRTSRQANYTLTEGAHPIVMGWYEGGSGANGTFWMSGGPNNAGEVVINPSAPLPGITFNKVSYTADPSQQGMNVTVNADSTLQVNQDTAIAYNALTLANAVKFTVTSPAAPISFSKTSMGSTGTLDVTAGRVSTGPITSGAAITNLHKTGGGILDVTDTSVASSFTSASTIEVSAGTFVGRAGSGAGAITPRAASVGDAKILINGGTFSGLRSAPYDVAGTAGHVGVTFYNGASSETMIGPFNGVGGIDTGPNGLLMCAGKAIDYAGDLRFDDDNPDVGNPNFNTISGGFVGVDNLQVLGYGMATFTDDPTNGSSYTIGSLSDDGATMWIDLDKNGKFETLNSLNQNELVHDANSFHGPTVTLSATTIPAGTYRFATGYYEGGGNAQMDFRIARGTATATDYATLKANFGPSARSTRPSSQR